MLEQQQAGGGYQQSFQSCKVCVRFPLVSSITDFFFVTFFGSVLVGGWHGHGALCWSRSVSHIGLRLYGQVGRFSLVNGAHMWKEEILDAQEYHSNEWASVIKVIL